jgi:hypothetical protein
MTEALVQVRLVVAPTAGHRHVQHRAGGGVTEDGLAALPGDTLRRVHRGGVAERHVLTDVIPGEHDAGRIGEPFGRKTIRVGVDRGHPPAVAVCTPERRSAGRPGRGDLDHQREPHGFGGPARHRKDRFARIVAEILFGLGKIARPDVMEVTEEDLVVGYVSQTAQRMKEVCEEALGGVLYRNHAHQ